MIHSRIELQGCGRKGDVRRGILWGSVVLLAILLLSGVADAITENITNSSFVDATLPDTNFGSDGTLYVLNYTTEPYERYTYIELPVNNSELTFYIYGGAVESINIQIYNSNYFDENTITWNNQPITLNLITEFTILETRWYNVTLVNFNKYIVLKTTTDNVYGVGFASDDTEYIPYIEYTPSEIIVSCPIGWCYLGMNYTNKTLLELDNLFSTDTIQGKFNSTSQKYESHRTGYNFNQNVSVAQKEGYYYYFSTATDITTTPGSTPSITLKTGWNLVANYGSSARTLSALKTSIGDSATQAKYYDKILKTWVSADSQSVPAMESFFVYVTSQTDWSN